MLSLARVYGDACRQLCTKLSVLTACETKQSIKKSRLLSEQSKEIVSVLKMHRDKKS